MYFLYVIGTAPHIDDYFNTLEIFNESCIILLLYLALGFDRNQLTDFHWFDDEKSWRMGYGAILIIAMIFVVNFTAMIFVTVKRMVMHYRRF